MLYSKFHPNGSFTIDDVVVSPERAFDCLLDLEPGCTWDSMMLAVERDPEVFDILCSSRMYGFKASDILSEYKELKDSLEPDGDLIALEFSWGLEVNETKINGQIFNDLIFFNNFSGIPRDPNDGEKYCVSLSSPAQLKGLELRINSKIPYEPMSNGLRMDDITKSFTVGDLFKTAFEDISFYGLGLKREEKKLDFKVAGEEIRRLLADGDLFDRESNEDDSNT